MIGAVFWMSRRVNRLRVRKWSDLPTVEEDFIETPNSQSPEGFWPRVCALHLEAFLCSRVSSLSISSFLAGNGTPWVVDHPGSKAQVPDLASVAADDGD